ncbi:MAG: hypothetical protein WA160_09795 [Pseudobdellovibrio sp.]
MIPDINKNRKPATEKSPRRIRPSIKKETILASDYNKYILPFSCEECSHFASETTTCTLGLNTFPHLKSTQQKSYNVSGQMALCRFQEID